MATSSTLLCMLCLLLLSMTVPTATALSMSSSLGGSVLRELVKEAARYAYDVDSNMAQTTLDLGGIVWLEHVNLVVGNKALAEQFYFDFLGMTRDSGGSFHANLGQQQFHLAENGEPAQRVTGSIGLAVPSLDTLRERVSTAIDTFQGTQFEVKDDANGCNGCMTITCPWGNRLHLYDVQDDTCQPLTSDSSQKMVKLHAEGGTYGPHRMAVRGNPGIRYLEISCRSGTAPAIAAFYRDVLSCTVSTPTPGQAVVSVGPGVHLVYSETDALTEDELQQMAGVHICIYVNDFQGLYNRLKERSLIWTNPRFTHLDSCDTWEEALASRTLRFKHIRDLKSDEPLMELEHEIRPLRHGQYLKVPNYDPK